MSVSAASFELVHVHSFEFEFLDRHIEFGITLYHNSYYSRRARGMDRTGECDAPNAEKEEGLIGTSP